MEGAVRGGANVVYIIVLLEYTSKQMKYFLHSLLAFCDTPGARRCLCVSLFAEDRAAAEVSYISPFEGFVHAYTHTCASICRRRSAAGLHLRAGQKRGGSFMQVAATEIKAKVYAQRRRGGC